MYLTNITWVFTQMSHVYGLVVLAFLASKAKNTNLVRRIQRRSARASGSLLPEYIKNGWRNSVFSTWFDDSPTLPTAQLFNPPYQTGQTTTQIYGYNHLPTGNDAVAIDMLETNTSASETFVNVGAAPLPPMHTPSNTANASALPGQALTLGAISKPSQAESLSSAITAPVFTPVPGMSAQRSIVQISGTAGANFPANGPQSHHARVPATVGQVAPQKQLTISVDAPKFVSTSGDSTQGPLPTLTRAVDAGNGNTHAQQRAVRGFISAAEYMQTHARVADSSILPLNNVGPSPSTVGSMNREVPSNTRDHETGKVSQADKLKRWASLVVDDGSDDDGAGLDLGNFGKPGHGSDRIIGTRTTSPASATTSSSTITLLSTSDVGLFNNTTQHRGSSTESNVTNTESLVHSTQTNKIQGRLSGVAPNASDSDYNEGLQWPSEVRLASRWEDVELPEGGLSMNMLANRAPSSESSAERHLGVDTSSRRSVLQAHNSPHFQNEQSCHATELDSVTPMATSSKPSTRISQFQPQMSAIEISNGAEGSASPELSGLRLPRGGKLQLRVPQPSDDGDPMDLLSDFDLDLSEGENHDSTTESDEMEAVLGIEAVRLMRARNQAKYSVRPLRFNPNLKVTRSRQGEGVRTQPILIQNATPAPERQVVGQMVLDANAGNWEGNEEDLRRFDEANLIARPARAVPALISSLGKTGTSSQEVKGMVFDAENASWVGNEEDRLLISDDEEDTCVADIASPRFSYAKDYTVAAQVTAAMSSAFSESDTEQNSDVRKQRPRRRSRLVRKVGRRSSGGFTQARSTVL